MEKKYICPCGLICTDCLFYKPEIYENAARLRDAIKESQLDIFLGAMSKNKGWSVIADHLHAEDSEFDKHFEFLKNLPEFMNVLDGLIRLQCKVTCRETGGCSIGGTGHSCEAVKCVQAKGYEGCWDCPEHADCQKLAFVKQAYGKTIQENFTTIQERGFAAVTSHGNQYYAWQRKINK